MAVNKLTMVGSTCVGVVLPLDELREEELVEGVGRDLEITEETHLRVNRFAPGAWQVVRTDLYDYPAFHEKQAKTSANPQKTRA